MYIIELTIYSCIRYVYTCIHTHIYINTCVRVLYIVNILRIYFRSFSKTKTVLLYIPDFDLGSFSVKFVSSLPDVKKTTANSLCS